ncbi:MAG: hypothetical protein AVDCRST_MAG79-2937, partial [uncultured Thermoleophilia bacterium]
RPHPGAAGDRRPVGGHRGDDPADDALRRDPARDQRDEGPAHRTGTGRGAAQRM